MIKYICQNGAPKIEDNKGRGAVHKPVVTPNKPVVTPNKPIALSGKSTVSPDKPVKRERITQQAIVAAAARLFAQKGFGATSLEDIADVLGATKGALYYHVKNKEEILRLIYMMVLTVSEEPLRRIVEADTSPQEKLRRAIEHQTTVAADRSPAMTVFFREQHHLSGPFAKEILLRKKVYERYFERIIEEGQQAGVFKANVDAKMVAFGLLGMCNSLSQWYRAVGNYTPQAIATMFEDIFATGLQG